MRLRYVLIVDGPSDDALQVVVRWSLRQIVPDVEIAESPTLLRRHRAPAQALQEALDVWRPDLVVLHRDAEAVQPGVRRREVPQRTGVVPLIPVRMTEAWLLFDEPAIRRAASRPRGTEPLDLPRLKTLADRPDPKADLEGALVRAAGSPSGRALRRVQDNLGAMKRRVAEYVSDFSPLRTLEAFRQWEEDLAAAVEALRAGSSRARRP